MVDTGDEPVQMNKHCPHLVGFYQPNSLNMTEHSQKPRPHMNNANSYKLQAITETNLPKHYN